MAITYKDLINSAVVYLDGKEAGQITHTPEGYIYWPKGAKTRKQAGEAFPTLRDCKRSIEGEDYRPSFDEMVSDAAQAAATEAKLNAREGIVGNARLYYKTGALLLTANPGVRGTEVPEGFIDSGQVMPCNIPYDQYARWIRNHSGNLPLF